MDQQLHDLGVARASATATRAVSDELVRLAGPFAALGDVVRPRRRRWVAALATAATLAAGIGISVPTGAAASTYKWVSVHTGLFGSKGEVETDDSEFLRSDSLEMRAIIERHTRQYRLPPGASWKSAYAGVITDETILVQERVVAAVVARTAACAWEQEWLKATAAADGPRREAAMLELRRVPTWQDLAATDPTGGLRRALKDVVSAASRGDASRVRADVAVNCGVGR